MLIVVPSNTFIIESTRESKHEMCVFCGDCNRVRYPTCVDDSDQQLIAHFLMAIKFERIFFFVDYWTVVYVGFAVVLVLI